MVFAFEHCQNIADVVQRGKKTLAQIEWLSLEMALPRRLLRHCSQTMAECFIHQALKVRATFVSHPLDEHCDVIING